ARGTGRRANTRRTCTRRRRRVRHEKTPQPGEKPRDGRGGSCRRRRCRRGQGRRGAWSWRADRRRSRIDAGGGRNAWPSPRVGGGLIPHRGWGETLPEKPTLGQGTTLIPHLNLDRPPPTPLGHSQYPLRCSRPGRRQWLAWVIALAVGPALNLALSLSVIWAASIGRRNDGKEIDIQEDDEPQSSEGQTGPRSGYEHDHDSGRNPPTT